MVCISPQFTSPVVAEVREGFHAFLSSLNFGYLMILAGIDLKHPKTIDHVE